MPAVLRPLVVLIAAALVQTSPLPAAPMAIQQLVRDALADRLGARDIPDLQQPLQDAGQPLAVRTEMPSARLSLTRDALPMVPGLTLTLMSEAALQAEAERRHDDVWFVTVDAPEINGDRATLSLGSDIATARRDVVKLCCCESRGDFARKDGRWQFVQWTRTRCS